MTRVGAIFHPYPHPPEELRDAAVAAERAGIAELWLWEDCFRSSAFAAASAALAWTERLEIGIGIAPMPLRNVALTAMEIATIARMFPGRLLPGVGHGVQAWMGQAGARVASPLTLLREYVPALRSLLAGEEVTAAGRYVSLDAVRLEFAPEVVPRVFAAAEGPKTLTLAGEVADGVVLDSRHTVEEIGRATRAVRDGRAAVGRGGDADVAAYVATAFGPGGVERVVAEWDGTVPADAADRLAAGTAEEVAEVVRRVAAAGVDRVVLLPLRSETDLAAFYERVGEVGRLVG